MDILCLAVTLLQLCGMVESIGQIFHRILELDGVYGPGAFQIYSRSFSEFRCARTCVVNGCVTFVYHIGDKVCYFYDWPLRPFTANITSPGGSVAHLAAYGVVMAGRFLSHYIQEEGAVLYLNLGDPVTKWSDANAICLQNGGELPPILDNGIYDRFNALDARYPGVVATGPFVDGYWTSVKRNSGTWENTDGSAATPLLWRVGKPTFGRKCAVIAKYVGSLFELIDDLCISTIYTPRYACRFTGF